MKLSWNIIVVALLLCLFAPSIKAAARRENRQFNGLSLFNVVKFENTACEANGNNNGTCYTAGECEDLGGEAEGSCASGLGVCCVFNYGCGEQSNLNNTYFKSSGQQEGNCHYKVCPCNDNICALRLDFLTFDIAGPDSDSSSADLVTSRTRCLEDVFSVSAPGQTGYGHLCGYNTGAHLYVDSSPMCNELNFNLGLQDSLTRANRDTPAWDIRITQIPCGSLTRPPSGCTQYYYGESSGTVQSFNFDAGYHLADQRQKICFRKERDFCRICFTQDEPEDFDTVEMSVSSLTELNSCFTDYSYRDYLQIPGLSTKTDSRAQTGSILCGSDQRISDMAVKLTFSIPSSPATSFGSATMCTRLQPFSMTFYTDDFETDREDGVRGFKLNWEQESCQRDHVDLTPGAFLDEFYD